MFTKSRKWRDQKRDSMNEKPSVIRDESDLTSIERVDSNKRGKYWKIMV